MPDRYTTKVRAKRIELHYFKRLYPFRRWKLILSLAVPAVAAAWLIVMAAGGDQRVYTSGPVSTGHAMFNVQCHQCHVPTRAAGVEAAGAAEVPTSGRGFWLRVSDQTCLKCHDGAIHHETEVGTTACAGCHVEHKGHVVLAAMKDQHCSTCHADLKTKVGTSIYNRKIDDFSARHPEFAVAVKDGPRAVRVRLDEKARLKDTAQVKLNHQKHMKAGLQGVDDLAKQGAPGLRETPKGLQMSCTFCHRPDDQQAYMAPISYQKHCAACHPLGFDAEKFPDSVAPHATPEIVHAFLRTKYLEASEGDKGAGKGAKVDKAAAVEKKDEEEAQPRRRPGRREEPAEEEPRARGRLGRREEPEEKAVGPKGFKEAETFLFANRQGQGCKLCHTVTAGDKLPEVAPTCIPARWLPHSRFDHGPHRPLACTECHKAMQSTETTDVLMPSIATCRECHRDGGARAGCVECHAYHDKVKTRDLNGPLTIQELLTGRAPPRGPSPVKANSAPGPC